MRFIEVFIALKAHSVRPDRKESGLDFNGCDFGQLRVAKQDSGSRLEVLNVAGREADLVTAAEVVRGAETGDCIRFAFVVATVGRGQFNEVSGDEVCIHVGCRIAEAWQVSRNYFRGYFQDAVEDAVYGFVGEVEKVAGGTTTSVSGSFAMVGAIGSAIMGGFGVAVAGLSVFWGSFKIVGKTADGIEASDRVLIPASEGGTERIVVER